MTALIDDDVQAELFGSFRLRGATGASTEVKPSLAVVLLAVLLLDGGRSRSREELLELLWPDEDPEATRPRLRQLLHTARRLLLDAGCPDGIDANRHTVRIDPKVLRTDVSAFIEAVAAADLDSEPVERLMRLQRAAALYRGDLLPGFYHDALRSERDRLANRWILAMMSLAKLQAQLDDYEAAAAAYSRVLDADPSLEGAHQGLIRALLASGNLSGARRQYLQMEERLASDLGVAPDVSFEELQSSTQRKLPIEGSTGAPGASKQSDQTDEYDSRSDVPHLADGRRPGTFRQYRYVLLALCALIVILPLLRSRTQKPTPKPSGQNSAIAVPVSEPLWVANWRRGKGDSDVLLHAATSDAANGIRAGGVYVTGHVMTAKSDEDFLTFKCDSNGQVAWEDRYDGMGGDVDRARDIAMDKTGHVYVVGDSDNGKGNGKTRLSGLDIVVIKYDPDGHRSRTWLDRGDGPGVRRYNGSSDGEDYGNRIRISPAGDIYVLGKEWIRGHLEALLIKFDKNGRIGWTRTFGECVAADSRGSLDVAPNGDPVVACELRETRPGRGASITTMHVIARLKSDGKVLWRTTWGDHNGIEEGPVDLALDLKGCAVVAGSGSVPGPSEEATPFLLMKFDSKGTLLWHDVSTKRPAFMNQVQALAVNYEGKIAVSGLRFLDAPGRDNVISTVTALYSPEGKLLWARHVTSDRGKQFGVRSIVFDRGWGALVVAGTATAGLPTPAGTGLYVLQYLSNGDLQFGGYFGTPVVGPTGPTDRGTLTYDQYGQSVVTGVLNKGGTNLPLVMKFGAPSLGRSSSLIPLPLPVQTMHFQH